MVKNLASIPEYGRYDDLMVLLDTPCRGQMLAYIKSRLAEDMSALRTDGESVSCLQSGFPR